MCLHSSCPISEEKALDSPTATRKGELFEDGKAVQGSEVAGKSWMEPRIPGAPLFCKYLLALVSLPMT